LAGFSDKEKYEQPKVLMLLVKLGLILTSTCSWLTEIGFTFNGFCFLKETLK